MKFEYKLLITFFVMYAFFAQSLSWGEYSKMDLFQAIVDGNTFSIDAYYNNTGDRSIAGGHYYSDKAPAVPFLSTGVYASWEAICGAIPGCAHGAGVMYATNKVIDLGNSSTRTYDIVNPSQAFTGSLFLSIVFMSALPSALTVLLVYKTSAYLLGNETHRKLLAAAYGLGTIAFAYGTTLFTHGLATFLVFLSFYIMFKMKNENPGNAKRQGSQYLPVVAAGISAGLAIMADYPAGIVSTLLFVYSMTFNDRKTAALFGAAMLLGAMPLAIYNTTILGSPFRFLYSFTDPAIRADAGTDMGFTSLPNPFILYRHTFDIYRGLFVYSPVLLLSVAGLYWMLKERRTEALLIIAAFAGMLVMFSMRGVDFFDFGASFGARNYLPVLPFMMLPLASYLKNSNFTVFKALFVASVFISFIGLQNWEWAIGGTNSVYIAEPYRSEVSSLAPLVNPLKDHYFPLFLQSGPRARIVENLLQGKDAFDVRHAFAGDNPYPFVTLMPLLAALVVIWHSDISIRRMIDAVKKIPEIFFVPLVMSLLLI